MNAYQLGRGPKLNEAVIKHTYPVFIYFYLFLPIKLQFFIGDRIAHYIYIIGKAFILIFTFCIFIIVTSKF